MGESEVVTEVRERLTAHFLKGEREVWFLVNLWQRRWGPRFWSDERFGTSQSEFDGRAGRAERPADERFGSPWPSAKDPSSPVFGIVSNRKGAAARDPASGTVADLENILGPLASFGGGLRKRIDEVRVQTFPGGFGLQSGLDVAKLHAPLDLDWSAGGVEETGFEDEIALALAAVADAGNISIEGGHFDTDLRQAEGIGSAATRSENTARGVHFAIDDLAFAVKEDVDAGAIHEAGARNRAWNSWDRAGPEDGILQGDADETAKGENAQDDAPTAFLHGSIWPDPHRMCKGGGSNESAPRWGTILRFAERGNGWKALCR